MTLFPTCNRIYRISWTDFWVKVLQSSVLFTGCSVTRSCDWYAAAVMAPCSPPPTTSCVWCQKQWMQRSDQKLDSGSQFLGRGPAGGDDCALIREKEELLHAFCAAEWHLLKRAASQPGALAACFLTLLRRVCAEKSSFHEMSGGARFLLLGSFKVCSVSPL